jgi:hypothetical protein
LSKRAWRAYIILNATGVLLSSFGTLDGDPVTGTALLIGVVLLFPGTLPVIAYVGQLTRTFDSFGVYGDHLALALLASVVNLPIWMIMSKLFTLVFHRRR